MWEFQITDAIKCLQTFPEIDNKDIFNEGTEPYSQIISSEIQVIDLQSTKYKNNSKLNNSLFWIEQNADQFWKLWKGWNYINFDIIYQFDSSRQFLKLVSTEIRKKIPRTLVKFNYLLLYVPHKG